jgi:hypothetical protein
LPKLHQRVNVLGRPTKQQRFGKSLLRVLLGEISHIAEKQIHIAPCCCPGMTPAEGTVLTIIDGARANPERARTARVHIAGILDCLAAVSVAQALAEALDDIGHPLRLELP